MARPSSSPDRFLTKLEVLRIVGFSAATLWREVRAGRFPAPVAISAKRIGFLQSEIEAWAIGIGLAGSKVNSGWLARRLPAAKPL